MDTQSPLQDPGLAWLLKNLTQEVAAVRGCVLLSSDGITKAAHGLDRAGSEHLAAVASGLFSMARGAAVRFDGAESVRQVVAELDSSQLFVSHAGSNSVLAVLAQGDADPAVVGFEMARLIRAVRSSLGTAARRPIATPGDRSR